MTTETPETLTCSRCAQLTSEDDATHCYLGGCQGTVLCEDCAEIHYQQHA